MKVFSKIGCFTFLLAFGSCLGNDDRVSNVNSPTQHSIAEDSIPENPVDEIPETFEFKYLALGDTFW